MHVAFSRTDHRPWQAPTHAWTWRQSWKDLLFAHWPIPAEVAQKLVPDGLTVQQFEGTSWIGVVPFRMSGVMRRPLPDLPWISAFPELNVRLYVERDGKPGVWFLSLDASNPLAVWGAKRWFHLPYYQADMVHQESPEGFRFTSHRRGTQRKVAFQGVYRPTSQVYESQPGTLAHFLTERYCLYAAHPDGTLYRGEVHHVPWPLQDAQAELECSGLVAPFNLELNGTPLLHFSRGVNVVVWSLERLAH